MKAKIRHRTSSLQKYKKRSWKSLALLLVGVLLLGAGLVAYTYSPPSASASLEYHPDDVAHDQPFLAIHEMEEGPPIPFLPANQAQPKIQIPEKNFDFGNIGPRDVVEREFIIRNVGDAPLTISRAYTTCGCTEAEISASVIPPGQVATIKLIFDAGFHDTAGQTVRRGLIIENNDPEQSQAEIWVQAAVRSN
ncbi:MAG: hypothetical protein DHS20C20_30050 [Ardenticatenaceae bacterium]|nr:MAG: hypothetical protein DHS20C20_30050 [Ardenticatenaceae bacterium]